MHAKASRRGQERAEVEAAGGGQGVDAVAISAFEIVATHQRTVFMIADHEPRRRRYGAPRNDWP
jgi:hypothetical protein